MNEFNVRMGRHKKLRLSIPAKLKSLYFGKICKTDRFLFVPAMDIQGISCASIVDETKNPFVIFHQQLGCFYSDWHRHEWGQLIYAEKGCIHLNSQDKIILVPSLQGVWVPANTYHKIWSESPQMYMRSICFPVAPVNDSLNNCLSVFTVSTLLREMIRYTEKWSHIPQDISEINTFLKVIQSLLPVEIEKSMQVYLPSTTHEKLIPVINYIHANLSGQINFVLLASQFGISERSLSRLFIQQLGISFSSYCKIARIMKALELIEMGKDSISQLAWDVGYESLATFSNNFFEICGHRPLHFIKGKRG